MSLDFIKLKSKLIIMKICLNSHSEVTVTDGHIEPQIKIRNSGNLEIAYEVDSYISRNFLPLANIIVIKKF